MISGELFQSLSEISLYSTMTENIVNQNLSMPQNLKCMHTLSPDDIKQYKKIFVYTHFIQEFFDKFYCYLNEGTILITHNSDEGIHSHHLKYLEGNKILRWYCQNMETIHPKLYSIPIGMANSQWEHGNQQLIANVKNVSHLKNNLVYKNFDINTNANERTKCHQITQQNNIPLWPNKTIDHYWEMLAKSAFVISPPGNGIDCHRIWEALYLRTVPVVLHNVAFSQFISLPILFVPSWDIVTPQYLMQKLSEFSEVDWNLPQLDILYWKEQIWKD